MSDHEYLKGVDSGRSCPGKTYYWIKRNLKTFVLVLVALAGLSLALANFLQPCVQEAVVSLNEVPFTNVTTLEESFIRLVPMDTHVALDHSGSLKDDFDKAKAGIIALMDGILNSTETIAQSANAAPGSKAELQFAFSKWTNAAPAMISPLGNDFNETVKSINEFVKVPKGGTAISTGLALCVETLLPEVSSAGPTAAPTAAPTKAPTETDLDDEVVTTSGMGEQGATKSCLIVTDGVAHDNSQTFLEGLTDAQLEKECEDNTRDYNTINEHQLPQGIINSLINGCSAGLEFTGLPAVLKACNTLGLQGVNCTIPFMTNEMRSRGIVIVGMYLGQQNLDTKFGQPYLRNLTSCADGDYTIVNGSDTCPFFVSTAPADIVGAATSLAGALVDSFASQTVSQVTTFTNTTTIVESETTYICAGDPLYLLFLMFLIPLAAYLLWRPLTLLISKYCYAPRKYEQEFTPTPMPQAAALSVAPAALAPMPQVMEARNAPPSWNAPLDVDMPVIPPPKPEPNTLIKEKRYKWSLKASDNYMWNLGAAGVGPMAVNFGAAAPPSAPKMPATPENMNRRTQRVSMRWSYVPPEARASVRASTRITSAIHDVIVPNYERASDRLEPFQEDEMQPGDLDYEYTMCLMKWFPCLRPRKTEQQQQQQQQQAGQKSASAFGSFNNNNNKSFNGSPTLQRNNSSMSTISASHGRTANPRFGSESAFGKQNDGHSSYAPSEYAQSEYGGASQAPSQSFGTRSYAQSQGQSQYDRQSEYSQSQYGRHSEYGGQSEFGQSEYGQSEFGQSEYGGVSEYSHDASAYTESESEVSMDF